MNAGNLLKNFETLAEAPGGIDRLRELILKMAVSGKLVEQSQDDGDASELVPKYVANQKLMTDDGVIGTQRFQRGGNSPQLPYHIPKNWRWHYLGDVGAIIGGGTPSSSVSSYWSDHDAVPWLTPADMRKLSSRYVMRGRRDITPKGLTESSAQLLPRGAVLFSSRAPIGHVAIAAQPLATNQGFKSCVPYIAEMNEYIYFFLLQIGPQVDANATGTTFKEVSGKQVAQILIPVPPLAEQRRIVAKVDELMALCDQLEQQQKHRDNLRTATRKSVIDAISTATTPEELQAAWKRINNNWEVIADDPESVGLMRELILDLAIRGKVVPQISSSNSVASLIQVMAQQKRRDEIAMGRQGKGSEFTRKNTVFNLPISWHKGFLGDIALIVMGNSPPGDSYRDNEEGVPLINGPVEFSKPQLGPTIRAKFTVAPTYMCKEGDLLVCVRGATTGRTNVSAFDACIGRGVALVRGWQSQKFINLFMWNIGAELLSKGKGTTFPSISFDDLAGLEIGLPPIEEQELIIKRVDELMALCDQLESELKSRSEVAEKFARSVVSAA